MSDTREPGRCMTTMALIIASEKLAEISGAHPSDIRLHLIQLAEQRYIRGELAKDNAKDYIQSNPPAHQFTRAA